ncbi:lytic murein transglycosylase [Azospirillum sp. RWY-5-1]|uniref:Lytic murein transglycosylase n=1 Tax=Azospirillum oleiclasticum TaxID=2735135 RepID=A0ABX2T5H1_9PROT|nr:lytic murein transglycosylase [Azospirillum oleiclasticum]NYZ12414.1 lytic murein transglycosylase [Azospirillum oleiclasticum]NYZ19574.1 lytic murein transglycosylase [Azospirillum oleiclasticum]
MSRSLPLRVLLAAGLLAGCQTTQTTPVAVAATTDQAAAAAPQPRLSFEEWLKGLRADAMQQGIRAATFDRAMGSVRLSDRVQELDNKQPEFERQVWQYLDGAVSDRRVQNGRQKLQDNAALLRRVSQRSGVPAEILVAHWGLESDYGNSTGGFRVVDALTTLAYEGRRTGYFRGELLAALRILDSGDIPLERMSGSWAGAMGQTQFMPTIFLKHAMDEDRDGRRDIWGSLPDVFASTAAFVQSNGWRAGERWGEEVTLPPGFPYAEAEYNIVKPMADWRRIGVRPVAGGELQGEGNGSVLLLGGHNGPAFLIRDNFRAIMRYNPSTSYALAVALLADRIEGRGPVLGSWPRQELPLNKDERMELQQRLAAMGFDPGGVDGIVGANTRNALRRFQVTVNEVPDGFATKALLDRLRQASGSAKL